MSEIRSTLERIERRVSMPEPAMERMLRRRERRERNARIAAAVVGLGVAVAGIVGALATLRVTGGTTPGSGDTGAQAAGDGGFVLPTIAIWTALVVLGLTVLAAVRLRRRLVHVDVEQEGRGPGGAAASARRPAAVPGTAPPKGGSEMDSKLTGVGISQAGIPEIRSADGKLRRTNRWLVSAVVLLVATVVALGSLLLAQTGEETATTPEPLGLAPAAVVEALDANTAALNAMDTEALAAFYVDSAVVTDTVAGRELEGAQKIANWYTRGWPTDWNLERVSEVVQLRDADPFTFAAFAFTSSRGSGIGVFELHDLEIVHQWIIG